MLLWSLLILLATADAPKHRVCSVSIGDVVFCSATSFTGQAVVFNRDLYRTCSVSIGDVVFCEGPFSGDVPIIDRGKVRLCKVTAGHIVFCQSTGFNGKAILMR